MITSLAVVVPAKNEEDEIVGCLTSLTAAVRHLELTAPGRVHCEIVVVLNGCRDATAELVDDFAGIRVVESDARSVGAARRAGAAHILGASDAQWLASTDADCRVPRDWLERMTRHADTGADVVIGTVRPGSGLAEPLRSAWFAAHNLADGHSHIHGANLGIRASTYAALGGWSALTTGEDVDLITRAESSPRVAIGRCGDVVVTTSSRRVGRAPQGFAAYLRDLEAVNGHAG